MKKIIVFCFSALFLSSFAQLPNQKFTISGYVNENGSKELLVGVPINIPEIKNGTTTNPFGFYSITLPAMDSITLIFSYIGYSPIVKRIKLDKDISLNIDMEPSAKFMKEFEVVAERIAKASQTTQMSKIDIPIQQIKDIPALLGEKDVLKILQLMPGVQKGGEGSAGFYVRGGGADQNLIILDDAPVYNAFHLFGFFSLFNGDALKSVELIKGGFPARYGGRLSSVLDMRMKEGNKEKIQVECGIGIVASRLTIEGPILKNKSSFLISGRRTYIDALIAPIIAAANSGSTGGYYFYDYNAKFNYDFGEKNRVYLSGYFGKDKFYFKNKFEENVFSGSLGWGNATATARWNHLFNSKLFSNTSAILSDYKFLTKSEDKEGQNSLFSLKYYSGIRDYGLKYDMDYHPSIKHYIRGGLMSTYHHFTIQALTQRDNNSSDGNINKKTTTEGVESAVYLEDDYKILPKLKANFGLRFSHFYTDGKNYFKPEPRISASYNIREDLAVKASYADMNQYIHLISNTGVGLPTDLWVPATKNLSPQNSKQWATGVAKDFLKQNLAVSIEGYYKLMDHVLGFKEGASFLDVESSPDQNETQSFNWEKNVTSGKGGSYGAEFLIQRKSGKLSGWIGYTLSWTQFQFDSLNFGKKFYAKYDRRHDVSLVGIYKVRKENTDTGEDGITLSGTWVYGTGNAITLPLSSFAAPTHSPGTNQNQWVYDGYSEYTDKNAFRMAPYHRLDFGIQFHKTKKHGVRTWELSVYNVYNRKNPYFYYITSTSTTGSNVLKQISLFPFLPSVSYNFKFMKTKAKKIEKIGYEQ
ncbi:MAG: TonB-dependent receptor [Bacteroidetes bacterium]|nr:MAG: TonB-dependent receptor [Bacteroidota bacterium]